MQKITSAATSINKNQLPRTSWLVPWRSGTINADIGGGRYDNFTEYLAGLGVTNYVYDPYNRDKAHNDYVIEQIRISKADTATVNNVLNVIKEDEDRAEVIAQAADAVAKDGGTAYFLIYEGNKSGEGRVTKWKDGEPTCWQENRKAESYIPEIASFFMNVTRKGNLIIAEASVFRLV